MRLAEFDELFRRSVRTVDRLAPGRLRLTLAAADGLAAEVTDLTARETRCCSFFDFTLTPAGDVLHLTVEVPPAHADVLDALGARASTLAS
jgi:hypothetical protein